MWRHSPSTLYRCLFWRAACSCELYLTVFALIHGGFWVHIKINMTVLFMRIHLNFLFSHKLPLINQLPLINRRVDFIFQWCSLVRYSFLSEMLQSGNYIPLVKGYLKIRVTCNMYDFFWRLRWWDLVNSPQKYQNYDSNKSNGLEILPSVGFTLCLRKFSICYQDGVGNAWRPNKRTQINAQETVPMHYSTSRVHSAVTGLMSVLWGEGEAAHLRQPTWLVNVAPSNPVASVSSTLY